MEPVSTPDCERERRAPPEGWWQKRLPATLACLETVAWSCPPRAVGAPSDQELLCGSGLTAPEQHWQGSSAWPPSRERFHRILKSTGGCLWSSGERACVKGQKLPFTRQVICAPFSVMAGTALPSGPALAGPVTLWHPGSIAHCFDLSACHHSFRDTYEELRPQLL